MSEQNDLCEACLATPGRKSPSELCPECGGTPSRKEREALEAKSAKEDEHHAAVQAERDANAEEQTAPAKSQETPKSELQDSFELDGVVYGIRKTKNGQLQHVKGTKQISKADFEAAKAESEELVDLPEDPKDEVVQA